MEVLTGRVSADRKPTGPQKNWAGNRPEPDGSAGPRPAKQLVQPDGNRPDRENLCRKPAGDRPVTGRTAPFTNRFPV